MIKNRGDSITRDVYFRDENDVLFDPDTQQHKIYDRNGAEKATLTPTKQATGVYRVTYSIPADATYGDWVLISKATKGTFVETEAFYFTVEESPGD